MAIISIDGWQGMTNDNKKIWIESCTNIVNEVLDIPLDEIVIFIRDNPKDSWGQAGIIGSDPDWGIKSRYSMRKDDQHANS
ncbi:4-oxalocrotonate tautomerase family protein [Bacillus sp. NPDC060175]|uniref:tautomerase family protein n=1 Tax=Bacillus sp. NPDC060175 TaxID=3347061 RepID=UPI00366402FC